MQVLAHFLNPLLFNLKPVVHKCYVLVFTHLAFFCLVRFFMQSLGSVVKHSFTSDFMLPHFVHLVVVLVWISELSLLAEILNDLFFLVKVLAPDQIVFLLL